MRVLRDEFLPTVPVPADIDVDEYTRQLFERWANSALATAPRRSARTAR